MRVLVAILLTYGAFYHALVLEGHRCGLAVALYQKYCGLGIGKIMLQTVLDAAKECGYEQAELEVVSTNERAIRLYESLGFEKYGTLTHSMKYQDDSYADDCLMMRKL